MSTFSRTLWRSISALKAVGMATMFWLLATTAAASDISPQTLQQLTERSFSIKAQAIARLVESGAPKAEAILQAMKNGDLYYRRDDKRLVFAEEVDWDYRITDALTNEKLGIAGRRDVRKVKINNRLRGELAVALARLQLQNPRPEKRLEAVNTMLDKIDEQIISIFEERLAEEPNDDVRAAMETGIAVGKLNTGDQQQQLEAIALLSQSLESSARGALLNAAQSDDKKVSRAAEKALQKVEDRIGFFANMQTLIFGLSAGSVLVLAAIGLAITFGVMGVINMAHGELIMLGAYTTFVVQQAMPNHIGLSILVAIPTAFMVSFTVGVAIERGVIRFLYGRPLETLLATFGISLVLQQTVRSIFGPLNRSVETPDFMSGFLEINPVFSITWNRLYIFLFSLAVFFTLFAILRYTRLGLEVRAVAQNRAMARSMGIRSARVDAMTFGLGSGIAGVAGVALSQLTNVGPNLGQDYIIDSFMVVVFGGVGNLVGTLVAGLSLGIANKLLEPTAGAVLAKILVLLFIILFIQKRPKGLFPQKGRAAD